MATAAVRKRPISDVKHLSVGQAQGIADDLRARLAAARQTIANNRDDRKPHAYRASQGDPAAIAALKDLRKAAAVAAQEVTDLEAALEVAEGQLAAAENNEKIRQTALARTRARALAQQFIEQSARADQAFRDAVAALERRRELRIALFATGEIDADLRDRLSCEVRLGCAIRLARLNKHLPAIHHHQTAADCRSLEAEDRLTLQALFG